MGLTASSGYYGNYSYSTTDSCSCFRDNRTCHHSGSMRGATGTQMRNYDTYAKKPEPELSNLQKNKLWLFNRRQEEVRRNWKRDQYARVRGQIRI